MSGVRHIFGDKRILMRVVSISVAGIWILLCMLYVSLRIESEKHIALDESKSSMESQFVVVIDRLESVLHEMANIAKVIALEPSVINLLETLEPTRESRFGHDSAERNNILSGNKDVIEESVFLQHVVDKTAYLTSFVLDASGIYVCGNIWRSPGVLLGRDYSGRGYFRDAMQKGSGIEFAVGKNRQVLSVFFSEVIQKGDRRLGVATVRQGTEFLNAQLSVKDAEVLVVDDNGVIVASTRPQWLLKHLAPSGLPAPVSPSATYGVDAVEDAGFDFDPSDRAFLRTDGKNWLWMSRNLSSGEMTVWLISPVPKSEGIAHYLFVFGFLAAVSGVLFVALVERSLEYALNLKILALLDPLTGLPNRNLLRDRTTIALARAKRRSCKLAVLFIDLDRFKQVNDTFGHKSGDKVLIEVSRRITASIRSTDTVARIGGDEFVVVLENIARENVGDIAGNIINAVTRPIDIGENSCCVGASVGISIAPDNGETIEILFRAADSAMYQAKKDGCECMFSCS